MRLYGYKSHFTDEEMEEGDGSGIYPWSTELVSTKGAWIY